MSAVAIDVIILSYATSAHLQQLTQQSIDSLLSSEDPQMFNFNITVIESNRKLKPFNFDSSKTIYPDEDFGFHRYLNIGAEATSSPLICFCNNDLIFHEGWMTEVFKALTADADLQSVSMYCPEFHAAHGENLPSNINYGYTNGILFTGWCFLLRRSALKLTGPFDNHFKFWYCDDDFRLTLQKHGLKNALVKGARVTHLKSETLDRSTKQKQTYLKYISFAYFKYKWVHHNLFLYGYETLKYRLKILLS